jgi:hypothetical protein
MNPVPTLDDPGLVRHVITRYRNDGTRLDFIRDALARHMPFGALLREAYRKDPSLKEERDLPMAHDEAWRSAMSAAQALTGPEWYPQETMEIALRHYWGLDVPATLREWRTYRDARDRLHVETVYFLATKQPMELQK